VLQAKQYEIPAQLRAPLPQARSSQSPISLLQRSRLQDVTLLLQVYQSQRLRGE